MRQRWKIVFLCAIISMLWMGEKTTYVSATQTQNEVVEQTQEQNVEQQVPKKNYEKPGTTKLSGSFKKNKVILRWKKAKKAEIYYIYRKNSKGVYKEIGSTKKLTYTDKTVKKGTYYSYKIVAGRYVEENVLKGKKSAAYKILADTIDPKKKMVAITFDDGPGPYTKEIVKCLKENCSTATFFVVGANVDGYAADLKEAYKAGCEIGSHTFNHSNLTSLSATDIRKQMKDTDKKVKKITGKNTTVMRTPYGAVDQKVKEYVGKPIILWSIDTLDWKTRNAEKTISAVMKDVEDGSVILMHDIHEPTKRAALKLIPMLKKEGYQLVTVSELAKYRGYSLKNGEIYHRFRK